MTGLTWDPVTLLAQFTSIYYSKKTAFYVYLSLKRVCPFVLFASYQEHGVLQTNMPPEKLFHASHTQPQTKASGSRDAGEVTALTSFLFDLNDKTKLLF